MPEPPIELERTPIKALLTAAEKDFLNLKNRLRAMINEIEGLKATGATSIGSEGAIRILWCGEVLKDFGELLTENGYKPRVLLSTADFNRLLEERLSGHLYATSIGSYCTIAFTYAGVEYVRYE